MIVDSVRLSDFAMECIEWLQSMIVNSLRAQSRLELAWKVRAVLGVSHLSWHIFCLSMGDTCQTVGQFGGKIPLAVNSPT